MIVQTVFKFLVSITSFPVRNGCHCAKTAKANPLLIEEKIGLQSNVLSPPVIATVCDESNDSE
jgi:hypothetical protein